MKSIFSRLILDKSCATTLPNFLWCLLKNQMLSSISVSAHQVSAKWQIVAKSRQTFYSVQRAVYFNRREVLQDRLENSAKKTVDEKVRTPFF